MAIPMVMAADGEFDGAFDVYTLLVYYVFGSIALSGVGIVLYIVFVGMISKMSSVTLGWLILFFVSIFGAGYIGALVAIPTFMFAMIWFMASLLNYLNSYR